MANKITNIGTDAYQQLTVKLDDGTPVVFVLRFLPSSQRWALDVTHKDFVAKGLALCLHPNMLRSFRLQIPFGLAVTADDDVDPFDINDFDSDRVQLYVLDNTSGNTEVAAVETTVFAP